jgi:guanine deaminase
MPKPQSKIGAFVFIEDMETTEHEKFMQMAIDLSVKNVQDGLGGPFGAVIVKDGEVVAASANKVVPTNDPTAHAEVSAIRLACQQLNTFSLEGCEIYTSCEPCPMCLGAIYWARLDKIYYANTKADAAAIGFDDHFIYDELDLPMTKRKLPLVQLLRDEALKAFRQWEESDLRTDY